VYLTMKRGEIIYKQGAVSGGWPDSTTLPAV